MTDRLTEPNGDKSRTIIRTSGSASTSASYESENLFRHCIFFKKGIKYVKDKRTREVIHFCAQFTAYDKIRRAFLLHYDGDIMAGRAMEEDGRV